MLWEVVPEDLYAVKESILDKDLRFLIVENSTMQFHQEPIQRSWL